MNAEQDEKFSGWAILELMGHRRLAGYLTEEVVAGSSFIRIDVPGEPPATQFYSPAAVYCITPTTEDIACAFAANARPAPVRRWELPSAEGEEPVSHARAGHYAGHEDDGPGF
jgi:hypothetical protein